MIIKQNTLDNDLYLLEAVSSGVRLIRWRDIAEIVGEEDGKWFSRVCYRKVNFERTDYINNKFIEFANQTIGAKYEISYSKLTRDKSTEKFKVKTKEDIMTIMRQALESKVTTVDKRNHGYLLINKDRTFFCSELVAKAFKELGIRRNNGKSSSKFYPKHFASDFSKDDKYLELTQGTTI